MQKALYAFRIVVLLLLCSGCTNNDHSVRVTDVRKDEVITLKNTHNQQHVYGIEIRALRSGSQHRTDFSCSRLTDY